MLTLKRCTKSCWRTESASRSHFCEFDEFLWWFVLSDIVGNEYGEYELYSVDDSVCPVLFCK